MSGLQSITYQTIVDAVKNYIKSNCINITNFAGISNVFKSGYSVNVTVPGGNAAATAYCNIYINGNNIVQATTTNVDDDMNSFLTQIGATDILSQNITDSEFIKFMNDMVIFCTTKMAYSTSIYAVSTKHLIYVTSQTSYENVEAISASGHSGKEIDLSDATSIINDIVNTAKRSIRCLPVQYYVNYHT